MEVTEQQIIDQWKKAGGVYALAATEAEKDILDEEDKVLVEHKTKSITLDSGYVRDGELRGRYQIYCTFKRAGGFLWRSKINLFGSDRVKVINKRHLTKRLRDYGFILLLSMEEGEVAHHINDEYVIGIPKEIHESMASNDKEQHRALVLEWLKVNNHVRYLIVLEVLNSNGGRN